MNKKVDSTVMDGVKSKKGDQMKNIVMDGSKVGKFGKVGKEQTEFEERRDGWSQKWKIWKI